MRKPGWELNRHESPARLAKRIIQFLGYFPFSGEGLSIGRELYHARLVRGKAVYSTILTGNSGNIILSALEPGFYILKIVNDATGKSEVKRIYKGHK